MPTPSPEDRGRSEGSRSGPRRPDSGPPGKPVRPRAGDGAALPRMRPLNVPKPVRVRLDSAGRPTEVQLERRRQVAAVRERWRIDDEWWRTPISREYADLVLENGQVVTVYWDRVEEGWFLQG